MAEHVTIDMLRAQIDQIDDQLLDLVLRRGRLTGGVAEIKALASGSSLGFRPGREAAVLRRLVARAGEQIAPGLVIQIWRALIGESLLRQGLTEILCAPGAGAEPLRLYDATRSYFGHGAPVQIFAGGDVRAALIRASEQDGVIASAPWPSGAGNGQWWSCLIESRFSELKIVGGWPVFAGDGPEAAFVARSPLESSGADDSLIIALDEHHRAGAALSQAGLAGEEKSRARAGVLIRVDGFVAEDDPRIPALQSFGLAQARVIGVCARRA